MGTKVPPLKKEEKTEIKDDEDVFLVLPSYAEPFAQQIQQIIYAEKQKLCKCKKNNAIFSNIKIRLAYTIFNICMDQHLRTDVEVFLTLKHLDPHTHQHIGKKEYFSDWTKKERDSPCSV